MRSTRAVGRLTVTCLTDARGTFTLLPPHEAFPEADAVDWDRARDLDPEAFGPDDSWQLGFHCFAIERPGGMIMLIDTGVGPENAPAARWAPMPGRLPEALGELGVDVRDINTVVQTHLHADHLGWAVTPAGAPMFPNAAYVVQRAEIAGLRAAGSPLIRTVIEPLRATGQLREIDGEVDLVGGSTAGPRVTAVPTPGHTAGHQSVMVADGKQHLVITGDVLVHAVQLANPEVRYAFESDPRLAHESRRRILTHAEAHEAPLATAHLNRPFINVGGPLARPQ
jgi:glyoxylase-like metal-dependent hydrolase (beta-lactamase superfamily II)